MLTRCEKCGCAYLIKMQKVINPETGKMGVVKCAECNHHHPWPEKKQSLPFFTINPFTVRPYHEMMLSLKQITT